MVQKMRQRREEYESLLLSLRLLVKALPAASLSRKARPKVNCDGKGPAVPSASYCLRLRGFASCLHPLLTLTASPVSQILCNFSPELLH